MAVLKSRKLQGVYVINARNSRLNGSNSDAEGGNAATGNQNRTFTKKIRRGRDEFPYVSGQSQAKNVKEDAKEGGFKISSILPTDKKNQSISELNPAKNFDEDIRGFMGASNEYITKEEYKELDKEIQKEYKSEKVDGQSMYKKNVTKKRKGVLQLDALQAVSPTRITNEWCTRVVDNVDNNLYSKEVYSAIMSAGFSLDISRVGVYSVSADATGFRDYTYDQIEKLKDEYSLEEVEMNLFSLKKEERFKRIKSVIYSLANMQLRACQASNLTDTSAKLIILAEYDWGNNIFIDIFDSQGNLNIPYIKETLQFNEGHRLSTVWVGVKSGFGLQKDDDGVEQDYKTLLSNGLSDLSYVKVANIKTAVDEYLDYLEDSL